MILILPITKSVHPRVEQLYIQSITSKTIGSLHIPRELMQGIFIINRRKSVSGCCITLLFWDVFIVKINSNQK